MRRRCWSDAQTVLVRCADGAGQMPGRCCDFGSAADDNGGAPHSDRIGWTQRFDQLISLPGGRQATDLHCRGTLRHHPGPVRRNRKRDRTRMQVGWASGSSTSSHRRHHGGRHRSGGRCFGGLLSRLGRGQTGRTSGRQGSCFSRLDRDVPCRLLRVDRGHRPGITDCPPCRHVRDQHRRTPRSKKGRAVSGGITNSCGRGHDVILPITGSRDKVLSGRL